MSNGWFSDTFVVVSRPVFDEIFESAKKIAYTFIEFNNWIFINFGKLFIYENLGSKNVYVKKY